MERLTKRRCSDERHTQRAGWLGSQRVPALSAQAWDSAARLPGSSGGFGLLNLTCDDETPEWFGQFMDWGYWVREDGSRAVSPNSRILGWRATMRDDMRWETPDERLVLGDIEEAVAEDPDHDWRLRIEGPMVGVVSQRHGRGQWVAIERLDGFA